MFQHLFGRCTQLIVVILRAQRFDLMQLTGFSQRHAMIG